MLSQNLATGQIRESFRARNAVLLLRFWRICEFGAKERARLRKFNGIGTEKIHF